EIKYDGQDTYYYRCNCSYAGRSSMCNHARAVFDNLLNVHGSNYFLKFKDWTNEKDKLLNSYGLTMNDPEAIDFRFIISYLGELQIQAPPAYIQQGDTNRLTQ